MSQMFAVALGRAGRQHRFEDLPPMGFSLSWIAINGMSPEKVQVALKLRGTGAREDVPDSPFAGAELPGGWYLVIADHDFPWFMHDAHLTLISRPDARS